LDQIQLMMVLAAHIHVGVAGPVAPSIELAPVVIQNIKTLAQAGLSESFGLRASQIIDEFNALTPIGFDSITSELNRTS